MVSGSSSTLRPSSPEPPARGVLGRPFGMLTRRRGRRRRTRGPPRTRHRRETVLRFVARVQLVATDERERSDAHPLRLRRQQRLEVFQDLPHGVGPRTARDAAAGCAPEPAEVEPSRTGTGSEPRRAAGARRRTDRAPGSACWMCPPVSAYRSSMSSGVTTSERLDELPEPGANRSRVLIGDLADVLAFAVAQVLSRVDRARPGTRRSSRACPRERATGPSGRDRGLEDGSSLTRPYFTASIARSTSSMRRPDHDPTGQAARDRRRERRKAAQGEVHACGRSGLTDVLAPPVHRRPERRPGRAAARSVWDRRSRPRAERRPRCRRRGSRRRRGPPACGSRRRRAPSGSGRRAPSRPPRARPRARRSRRCAKTAVAGRAAVGAGRVVQQDLRGARRPRAHRRVQDPARVQSGPRTDSSSKTSWTRSATAIGSARIASRPVLRTQVAERLAELQSHDRVGERRRLSGQGSATCTYARKLAIARTFWSNPTNASAS